MLDNSLNPLRKAFSTDPAKDFKKPKIKLKLEFSIGKCAMLLMKSGKRHLKDVMEQPNQNENR